MIVDASVALKWLLREPDSPKALDLLGRDDLCAPAVLRFEIGYALTKRVRRRELSAAEAALLWRELDDGPLRLIGDSSVADSAFELSISLRAGFYDCAYLALAIAEDDVLVTADEGFAGAVRSALDPSLERRVRLLAELA